jgi:SAM-dependent methyltransferase
MQFFGGQRHPTEAASGLEGAQGIERWQLPGHVRFSNIMCSDISVFNRLCTVSSRAQHEEIRENIMPSRHGDGSAGDANYGVIGENYTNYRQPEPHFAAAIRDAMGASRSVLNIGAGAGSYEPIDRQVTALEPSASMRAQRPTHLPVAIDGVAEHLPFADKSFDASMATFSVHQWQDLAAGLAEMRRVTTGPVLILTCDPAALDRFWLNDYAPEAIATEARRYPSMQAITEGLGGNVDIQSVPIPLGCVDGFSEAYYGRPERLLEPGARLANSAWSFVDPAVGPRFVEHLGRDLADGTWDKKYGHLRSQPFFDGSLRLIVGRP